ncbi:AzlD domain-containing protein [Hansschlegelia sp. KR7-227]|jgi:hypothetical protein|uniref:AzlD domain-containing protein n=1 Tax=Hansschlegelia sp. KR7-227 TaxID=3400914 RepID=UPI003C0A783D
MNGHDAVYLVLAVLIAFVANDVWRMLGVVFAARIDESSTAFVWVKLVATALVAGLVAKFLVSPTGGLATAPLWLRLGALAFGSAGYALGRRSLALGVLAGEAVLIGGMLAITA